MQENRNYRIRTKVGSEAPDVISVKLDQTYDLLEILSLKLSQENAYRLFESNYGIIAGRVLANGGFGIPNAKISVFIELSDEDKSDVSKKNLYPFTTTESKDNDRVRYNLLPDEAVNSCHQNVGTFPNKRLLLDNDNVIEIFDKYWKYTTCTNESGDFMLIGIPKGMQQIHVDLDLSDIGLLSQRPRDMVYKGYNINQFESPNKFKQGKDLNSLAQIYSQNKGVYVYPFWGDTTDTSDGDEKTIAVTRCDIDIDYKFEPTCIFMGSVVTDKGSNAISQNCTATDNNGKMADLVAAEGSIEMIRKTPSGSTEEFPIKGNRLIDGDGVWCYQIPMNLDYVTTDEFGNLVQTDNPDKGIPTRARVRFRFTLDENPDDAQARKRCKMLVPNNPRISNDFPYFTQNKEADYEFGTNTLDESYVDMFWNNVYTVKSYIPRLQKTSKATNKKHTGIKLINHAGDNLQFPYNSLLIKLSFTYRLICVITKVIIYFIMFLNTIISLIGEPFCWLKQIFKALRIKIFGVCITCWAVNPFIKLCDMLILPCIKLSSEFCDDGINRVTYYPGCGGGISGSCVWKEQKADHVDNEKNKPADEQTEPDNTPALFKDADGSESRLFTCVENSLAQDNDATSFNFSNDWVNGCLYFPLWYRKITAKKSFLFGLFKKKAKDQWCSANGNFDNLVVHRACALNLGTNSNFTDNSPNHDNKTIPVYNTLATDSDCGKKCHERNHRVSAQKGIVVTKENMLGQTVYYYKAVHFNTGLKSNDYLENVANKPQMGEVMLLWATDIVLLGSLNDCDQQGIPQFFRRLEPSTYNLPTDILFTDSEILNSFDENGDPKIEATSYSEMSGCDWGNHNSYDECSKKKGGTYDGGLFYGIGCNSIEMIRKTCINLSRVCEFGVTLDMSRDVFLHKLRNNIENGDTDSAYKKLIMDGFISYDELNDIDGRSMFATMNYNNLRTKRNPETGLKEYVFKHLYVDNFDGQLQSLMQEAEKSCGNGITYSLNYKLENTSKDYYRFRMGAEPYFYNQIDHSATTLQSFPRYENSFYFYFGIKQGKSAIEKFNSQFFSTCENVQQEPFSLIPTVYPTDFCAADDSAKIEIDLTGIITPYTLSIIKITKNSTIEYTATDLSDTKVFIGNPGKGKTSGYTDITSLMTYTDDSDNEESMNLSDVINGNYIITATDANGNVMSREVDVTLTKLSYQVEKDNFVLKYEDIVKVVNPGSYSGIANYGAGTTYNNKRIDIGGTLIIDHILSESELNYVEVQVKALRSLDEANTPFEKWDWNAKIKMQPAGSVSGIYEFKSSNDSDVKQLTKENFPGILRIPLPCPNVEYEITITQLCGNNGETESQGNTVTTRFTMDNPVPYKLFINDVNHEVVKNFKSGWTASGTPASPNFTWNGTVVGWNHVSRNGNIRSITEEEFDLIRDDWNQYLSGQTTTMPATGVSNIIQTITLSNDGDSPYYWPSDMCLNLSAISELTLDDVNDIITSRLETIDKVKDAFFLRCAQADKTIALTVKTNNYPVYGKIVYKQEEESENDGLYIQTLKSDYTAVDGLNISGIYTPSLTHDASKEFYSNQVERVSTPTEWKNVTPAKKNGIFRGPFAVAVVNSKKLTIPPEVKNDANTHVDADGMLAASSALVNYYTFPIIDKILKFNYLAWSLINKIPYYKPTIEELNGQYAYASGFISGVIHNGIPIAVNSDGTTEMSDGSIGPINLKVMTYIPSGVDVATNEDALPTKRIVYSVADIGYGHYFASDGEQGYQADGTKNNLPYANMSEKRQYSLLPPTTATLELGDSTCTLNDSIYGAMTLNLLDSSIDDGNTKKLSLSISNGDSGADMTYYIFQLGYKDVSAYPINLFSNLLTNPQAFYKDKIYGNEWVGLYRYGSREYYQTIVANVKDTENPTIGFNTTGNFNDGITKNKQYFVVGMTENNCRTISPVYDFTEVTGKYELSANDVDNSYSLLLYPTGVEAKPLYYLQYYTFNATAELTLGSVTLNASNKFEYDPNGTSSYKKVDDLSSATDLNTIYVIKTTDTDGTKYECYKYPGGYTKRTSATGDTMPALPYDGQGVKFVFTDVTNGVFTYCFIEAYDSSDDDDTPIRTVGIFASEDDYNNATDYVELNSASVIVFSGTTDKTDDDGNITYEADGVTPQKSYLYDEYSDYQTHLLMMTTDIDPTLAHYERPLVIPLNKEQYNTIKNLSIFGGIYMKNNLKWYITDVTGLKHRVTI